MTRIAPFTLIALLACVATPAFAQYQAQSVQAFRAADANGDERLTQREFRVFIQQLASAGAPLSRRIQNLGAYGIAFNRTDADGNGLLTPAELRSAESTNR